MPVGTTTNPNPFVPPTREALKAKYGIDNDDFETYRIDGRRKFRILPGRSER